jgi:hypothetical protein
MPWMSVKHTPPWLTAPRTSCSPITGAGYSMGTSGCPNVMAA